ncbi:MAG: hypothetical protein ABJA98_33505 [Acidobacteriota bacterium]
MMWRRLILLGLATVLASAPAASAAESAQAPAAARASLAGIAVDETLDAPSNLLAALPRSPAVMPPLVARIGFDLNSITTRGSSLADLDNRLSAYKDRQVSVVVNLGGLPGRDDQVDAWQQAIRAVAERARGKVAAYQIGALGAADAAPAIDRYLFLLKLASVQLRSVDADALVLEGSVPSSLDDWQVRLYAAGAAPYIDGIALTEPASRASVERMTQVVERQDPTAVVVLGPIALPDAADAASSRFLDTQMQSLATAVRVISYTGSATSLGAVLTVAARGADLFGGNLVTVDERAAGLRLSRGGVDVTASTPHRLLFSTSTFATFLFYDSGRNPTPFDVVVSIRDATAPQVRDLLAGASIKPVRVQTPEGAPISLTVPAAAHWLVLDFNGAAVDRFTESAEVKKDALPSVEEIIARHQRTQAAQDAALVHYTAHMRLAQHFHPSPSEPAWNIVTENRVFFEKGVVEWEELSFSLNGATWTANRPTFPLVQPEKVLSLPLDLRLGQDYKYRLDGLETVAGRPAYVVHFDPVGTGRALFRGTVWIDRQEFVRLKVQAVETHLTGVVVSNDETHTFSRVGVIDGKSIWLLERQTSKQMFLVAGRTLLVEREARVADVVLNPPDFEGERTEARAGSRIMYRDTAQGLRYLVKRGETRVVSEQMTSSTKALAFGAQIDPSFDQPLPLGGLDVIDFNFLNKDMQLALLFAGVFAAGNVQRANLWGGRFDASVDFFGLAVKSNDSLFDAQGEQAGQRVDRVPVSTGFNVGFQATAFQKLTAHYELKYDLYFRDEKTSQDFTIPASTGTHGVGAGYEYRRGGYSLVGNLMAHRRTSAESWGPAGNLQPSPASFTTYDLGGSKDFIFATFHTIHLNGAYFGGDRLDRFSMYQFGFFDAARMHGVPSAVRFGELAMFRGSYSFNLFNQYRVDLFVDHARGKDTSRDNTWLPVTGFGLGLNLRTPRSTVLRVDLGKSLLPDAYRGAGSTVVQIMLLKPL